MSTDADLILAPDSEFFEEQGNPEQSEVELIPENTFEEILKEFKAIYKAVQEQSDDAYEYMQELQAESLAQATLLTQLYKLAMQQQEMLRRTKDIPDQLQALTEPIQKLQAQQNAQMQSSRRESRKSPTATKFSTRVVLLLMLGQSLLVASATAVAIHYFPPDPSIKAQQQSLAIFQRLDRLYKDRFGN